MRIIAGENRGTPLTDVGRGDAHAALRPTSDRVREAVFSMLMSGKYGRVVEGAEVLDLFAGTGALGLEALSRGAARVTFVDDGKVARDLLARNIAKLRREGQTKVLAVKAEALPPANAPCDLIFLDPPYGKGLGADALVRALAQGWVKPGAMICWEEASVQPPLPGFLPLDQRRFGDTWVTLLRAAPGG